MMSTLLLLTCAALPTWLTTPSPGEVLRWSPAAVERFAPGVMRVTVGPVPALRFDGRFGSGCELRAELLSGRGAVEVRQPLALISSPGHRHLVVPHWVTSQSEVPARVEVTGCVQDVVAWQGRIEPLEYGLAAVAEELRTLARAGPPPKFAEEAGAFPAAHRWQREAVWALTFPAALEALPGPAEASRALREALIERVILEARADDPTFGESHPVEAASPGRRLGSENGAWRLIRPGAEVLTPVDGDVLHLYTRVAAPSAATSWRVGVRFDEGPEVVLTGLAGADPEVPGMSRQRGEALLVPPGARQLHLRTAGGEVWWRAYVSRRRPHLEDALAGRDPVATLHRAELLAGEEPRTRLVRAWARALRGDPAALVEARTLARGEPRLNAWLAVVAAELAPDAPRASALAEAWPLVRASADGLLESRLVTLELQQGLLLHREVEVLEARAAHFAARPPTIEAALDFAELEAQAAPELDTAPSKALEVLDALRERFPLERRLETARKRHFALATSWSHLGAAGQPRGLAEIRIEPPFCPSGVEGLLELSEFAEGKRPSTSLGETGDGQFVSSINPPSQDEGTIEPLEGDLVRSPARALLGRVPSDGTPLALDVPHALLPGRQVTVDCFVERGAALPRALTVRFDERPLIFPALQRRGQFSVGLAPGAHHVNLDGGDWPGQVWCGWAVSPTARLRRYLPAAAQRPVRFAVPAGANLAQLTVRRAPGEATPLEVKLLEAGEPESRILLTGAPSPAEGAVSVSFPLSGRAAPLSVTLSGAAGIRLSLRRRRPTHEATESGSVRGGGVGSLTLEPGGGDEVEARLQRAATLLELDEVALAREDLLAVAESGVGGPSRQMSPRRRTLLRHLWRTADEQADASAASVPDDGAALEVPVSLARDEPSLSVGLIELADDDAFLRAASPELVRKRAGAGAAGDLALWLAASVATQQGAPERAAALWSALAKSRPNDALIRRATGEALLLDDTANHAALAVVELEAALRLRPLDALARRLLKRALARTRLRVAKLADSSAGVLRVKGAADTWEDPLEASLLGEGEGEVVTRGRPVGFAVDGPQPHQVVVRVRLVELRPHATPAEAPALELTLDEQPLARMSCLGLCSSAPLEIPPGAHRLSARLVGGVRPAARVKLEGAAGPAPLARPSADFFVARPGEPLVLTVQGPASARLELRSRVDRQGTTTALVDAAGVVETVTLEAVAEPGAALEGGTPVSGPRLVSLSLEGAGPRLLKVTPTRGEVLVRVLLREPFTPPQAPPHEDEGPLATAPPAARLSWAAPGHLSLVENSSGVAPGLESLGSLELVTALDRRVESRDGADVPPAWSWSLGGAWRRRLDEAFLTVKAGGQLRVRQWGQPVGKLSGEAFFLHPDFKFLRAHLQLDGLAQRVGAETAFSGRAELMLEPVVSLRPGLSLVAKAGVWLSGRSLRDVDTATLPQVDPDLFSRFDAAHPRGLFLEAGLQWMPFANVVLFGNTRLTTNPSMSPLDQDHVSATFLARALWGRVFTQVQVRGLWFAVDDSRPDAIAHATIYGSVFSTWWINPNLHLEAGVWASARFGTDLVQASVYLAWEGSNGRRFRDHTPLEGEDSFFPQRGPPREVADLEVPR